MGHKHSEAMLKYAQDASVYPKPWKYWEFRNNNTNGNWDNLSYHPRWDDDSEYRQKPNTIVINGVIVQRPLTIEEVELGTTYYLPRFSYCRFECITYDGSSFHRNLVISGLVHRNESSAALHSEALKYNSAGK